MAEEEGRGEKAVEQPVLRLRICSKTNSSGLPWDQPQGGSGGGGGAVLKFVIEAKIVLQAKKKVVPIPPDISNGSLTRPTSSQCVE